MDIKDKTKVELEALQVEKEDALQKCLGLLEIASGEKRRIKREILQQKSIVADANNKIAKINEEFDTWLEAVEKAGFNKERINSELREIQSYIWQRLKGE